MSAVVKTVTPFIDKECLLKALDKLELAYTLKDKQIRTKKQVFNLKNGHYTLDVYSYNYKSIDWNDYKNKNSFLKAIETEYNLFYIEKIEKIKKLKQEQELKKLEEERKAFVENQKQQIIKKAKAKGYSVKEKMVKNKVKLILVRHTY